LLPQPLPLPLGVCKAAKPLPSCPPPGVKELDSNTDAGTLSGAAGAAKLCGSADSARAAAAAAAGLSLLQRGEPGPTAAPGFADGADADATGRAWLLGCAGGDLVRMTGITRPGSSWPPLTLLGASLSCRCGRGEPSSRRLVRRRQASVALTATYTASRDKGARGDTAAVSGRGGSCMWLSVQLAELGACAPCMPAPGKNWHWHGRQAAMWRRYIGNSCASAGRQQRRGSAGQVDSLMRAPEAIAPDTSAATNREKASTASTDPTNTPGVSARQRQRQQQQDQCWSEAAGGV
jgi:hypothetical protein